MIQVGQKKKARYWGNFRVKKVATLAKPQIVHSEEVGEAKFNPTLVQIEWESNLANEFWFPYWITIKGKERYGQFAPMMDEASLLELLEGAIKQEFFSQTFLQRLNKVIADRLG